VTDKVIGDLVMATSNGEAFGDAIKRLLDISVPSDLAFTLRTLELAATGGVGGVLALERAAIVLRERSVNIHDRKTQAAQAMLSTQVLSWAPVVVAGWLIVTSTAVRNFLLLSLAGWFCILLGVGFNYAGRKWMQTIVSPKPQ
jgi:Flp pilus assembly protein TadB